MRRASSATSKAERRGSRRRPEGLGRRTRRRPPPALRLRVCGRLSFLVLAFPCCLILASVLLPSLAPAQVPTLPWRTSQTEHFRVTYPPGLQDLAWHTADRAEVAYARLSRLLTSPPEGKIDVLLTDHIDETNGYSGPFPSNRIVLFAKPPVDGLNLLYYGDWTDLLVTHELTHTFHLDRAGRGGMLLRAIFGRVPSAWPLFPAFGTPDWNLEGVAVFHESRLTGFGRIHGTMFEMAVRTAALENAFSPIDRASNYTPIWPGSNRHYIYGSLFVDYLARNYGQDVERKMIARTAAAVIPATLNFDRIGKKATGRSFTRAWGDWREEVRRGAEGLKDSLSTVGLTEVEPLTKEGSFALFPRVSPDGRRVAFAAADGRREQATRLLDPESGRWRDLGRRNSLGPSCWLPDGRTLMISQIEHLDTYRSFQDLYLLDERGRERRLTHGLRLQDPDLARNGRTAVAVMNEKGTDRLVLFDLPSRRLRALTDALPGVHWACPRWDPQGRRIAAARWEQGNYDIAILDTLGAVISRVTRDRAVDTHPAWSPDGRWLLFSSDRSGIADLYAADMDDPSDVPLRQVTNLLTGAFYPDVSPDGAWIYFSCYHADGYHIARIPFTPANWREAPPIAGRFLRPLPAEPADSVPAGGDPAGAGPQRESRPYRPLRDLLPRAWLPVWGGDDLVGQFYGFSTWGNDLVGRHSFQAQLALEPKDRRVDGYMTYSYSGLGNPILSLSAYQSWDGTVDLDSSGRWREARERERSLEGWVTIPRVRYRSQLSLSLTTGFVERERAFDQAATGQPVDPRDRLIGLSGWISFSTATANPFSVSRESGIRGYLLGRRRWDLSPSRVLDDTYTEARVQVSAYRAFSWFGFCRHTLAGRVSGLWRQGPGAGTTSLGGAPGGAIDLVVTQVGTGTGDFPIRGFPHGIRWGSRIWTANLEYRIPLLQVGRGFRQYPLFLDRIFAATFLDAGDAWCRRRGLFRRCGTEVDGRGRSLSPTPLIGAGAEMGLDINLFFGLPMRLRAGVGIPLRGPKQGNQGYVVAGTSF